MCLTQALVNEGINIDEHLFEIDTKVPATPKRNSKTISDEDKPNKDEEDDEKVENVTPETAVDAAATDAPKTEPTEESVKEKPESQKPKDDPVEAVDDDDQVADEDADQTGASDKLLDNNVDNEDSLNLTIGEDEAKIFQDEVCRHGSSHFIQRILIS